MVVHLDFVGSHLDGLIAQFWRFPSRRTLDLDDSVNIMPLHVDYVNSGPYQRSVLLGECKMGQLSDQLPCQYFNAILKKLAYHRVTSLTGSSASSNMDPVLDTGMGSTYLAYLIETISGSFQQ